MWWMNLLWSSCDHKTLRWCDTEDMRKEKNPWWHYWASHWAVAQNFQWCEIINFPRGKSRLEILSLTPGSVLTGTPGEQPQFYSHVDYFFLLNSIFQGPLFPLGLGENGYTLIVVWKKALIWRTCHQQLPASSSNEMRCSFHEIPERHGFDPRVWRRSGQLPFFVCPNGL